MIVVRLFRPLDVQAFINTIPKSVVSIAVLDRSKEPNGIGEALYMNVVNALNEAQENHHAHVIGGRYGLSSKEFTPAMVKAVFRELKKDKPKIIAGVIMAAVVSFIFSVLLLLFVEWRSRSKAS